MLQYQTAGPGEPLTAVEAATPEPTGSEVLLATVTCGVCHSDIHLHDGHFDLGGGKALPVAATGRTLGHEVYGEVVATGPDATGIAVGDRRVVYPWIGCGTCNTCERGDEHLCLAPRNIGIHAGGGFGDHVLVPHPRYLFDAGDTHPALAATYACSGLTAYASLKRIGERLPGDEVVIIGAGGLGMMALQIGRAAFGLEPIVVDIDESKLAAAREAGAKETIDPRAEGAAERVKALSDGGAVAAVDYVGSEASAGFGLSVLRKGGRLVIVGMFGGQFTFPLPFFPMQARIVEGNYVGSPADMGELMTLVRDGRIPPITVTERPAGEATDVLAELKAGKVVGRAVLRHR